MTLNFDSDNPTGNGDELRAWPGRFLCFEETDFGEVIAYKSSEEFPVKFPLRCEWKYLCD
jgi:hypothetical protein